MEPLSSWAASSALGICIRDRGSKVLFQNEVCASRCGMKVGESCFEGCMTLAPPKGVQVFERVKLRAGISEVARIDTSENLTTIFRPIDTEIEALRNRLETAGLSKREKEVAELALAGRSNREIAASLFISRATLKTHLNVIYRKMPQLKTGAFRARRRA